MPIPAIITIMGFKVARQTLIKIGIGLGILVGVGLLIWAVKAHFDQIDKLEERATKAETRLETVTSINEENAKGSALNQDIQQDNALISAEERATARARAQTYREIQNAIQSSTQPDNAVPPVIADTLNQLWDQGDPSDKGSDGIR